MLEGRRGRDERRWYRHVSYVAWVGVGSGVYVKAGALYIGGWGWAAGEVPAFRGPGPTLGSGCLSPW